MWINQNQLCSFALYTLLYAIKPTSELGSFHRVYIFCPAPHSRHRNILSLNHNIARQYNMEIINMYLEQTAYIGCSTEAFPIWTWTHTLSNAILCGFDLLQYLLPCSSNVLLILCSVVPLILLSFVSRA